MRRPAWPSNPRHTWIPNVPKRVPTLPDDIGLESPPSVIELGTTLPLAGTASAVAALSASGPCLSPGNAAVGGPQLDDKNRKENIGCNAPFGNGGAIALPCL